MARIDENEWKKDSIRFWFGFDEKYDTKEKKNILKRIERINSLGLGSDNRNVESQLRKHKRELKWKEPELRGRKKKKNKVTHKIIDLYSGYEEGRQWRIRMRVNSEGEISYFFDF